LTPFAAEFYTLRHLPGNVRRFTLPPLSCDAHCHVFGPAARFPYARNRRYTPDDAPKERLAELHRVLGFERAVVVQASCHGTDNSAMLDAIASAAGRRRGVAIVDDTFRDADYAALHERGIRGVRFNFVKHLGGMPDPNVVTRVVERIRPLGWHVVVHLDAADIVELSPQLRRLPTPFVIDHMGRIKAAAGLEQPAFQALLELVALERCWVKVCGAERVSSEGPPFHDAIPFAHALIARAPDRVLWGTDWPHPNVGPNVPSDGDLVDLLPLIAPDSATLHALLVANPLRLYDFTDS
jgi:predicted TIM-barrel fold metal-dependent hydrolase